MVATYSGDPASSTLDEVRFLIGDTTVTDALFQNDEITYLLTGRTPRQAAIAACQTLARRFARLPGSRSIGEVSISYGDLSKRYAELALAMKNETSSFAATPYLSGGVTTDEPLQFSEDTEQWENHQVTGGYTPTPDLTQR